MDWVEDLQALHNHEDSRTNLLAWIPVMAKSKQYNVQISDFVLLESKEKRNRNEAISNTSEAKGFVDSHRVRTQMNVAPLFSQRFKRRPRTSNSNVSPTIPSV